jgi:hypothetical protein
MTNNKLKIGIYETKIDNSGPDMSKLVANFTDIDESLTGKCLIYKEVK